jgi:hypothetical protein
MKSLINICLLLSITLASCTDIYFNVPQPKGVKPLENGFEELIGEYVSYDENSEPDDTVIVTGNRIVFPDDEDMEGELGEVTVVKKYKGHYFMNFYDQDKDLWQLIVAKFYEGDVMEVTNLISVGEEEAKELTKKRFAKKVGGEEVADSQEEDEYIIINPSKKQLMKLIDYPIFDENKMNLNRIKIK